MEDLNDLVLFAAVVSHGGFSGAARALGISKSRVSRRVAELEERLTVRLLQRSTRSVRVTEVGAAFFAHCESMSASARAAYEVAARANAKPSGRLRVSCPIGVAHLFMAPLLPAFLQANPGVRLDFELSNRRVDPIGEGYDVAIRIRTTLDDSELVVRHFGTSDQVLVASPAFVAAAGPFDEPEALQGVKGVGPAGVRGDKPRWQLASPDGDLLEIGYSPVFASDDGALICRMALAGLGVAQLPFHVCEPDLRDGRLVALLPGHAIPAHQLHAVYPSRRGMVPAVKAFIDLLGAELPPTLARANRAFETMLRGRMTGGL